jgi:allantoin racemase
MSPDSVDGAPPASSDRPAALRILIVNPNTSAEMTADIATAAAHAAAPSTEVRCVSPDAGPQTIEGVTDETLAAAYTVELLAGERDGYDGYVIACYGDPAVTACRELLDAPVVGIAEASFHMACLVAHRWSVITLLPRLRSVLGDLILRNGLERRCASIRSVSTGVGVAGPEVLEALLEEARRAVRQDGGEAILLGCAGLGPIAEQMRESLDVPVLEGVACAVTLVEALAGCGLRTSKAGAFAAPLAKPFHGATPNLSLLYAGDR